ncbi:MAG: hypothetical protein EB117_09085 [Betaproteobacteria bacterium]|nr:hypothetical protein [Betaproteobacteria bacterium]
MTTHYIKANILKAVSLCASNEETRYYLNGVYVEQNGGIVATDGHTMACYGISAEKPEGTTFILSNADIKKLLAAHKLDSKAFGKNIEVVVRLTLTEGNKLSCATVVQLDGEPDKVLSSFDSKPIDGTFPEFRRVIPSGDDRCGDFSLNITLLSRFGEAAKLVTGEKLEKCRIICRTNTGPIEVQIEDEKFLGVIMPMRW